MGLRQWALREAARQRIWKRGRYVIKASTTGHIVCTRKMREREGREGRGERGRGEEKRRSERERKGER